MIKFGGADKNSIRMLESFKDGFFISELIDNTDKNIQTFLRQTFLENGAVNFHSGVSSEVDDFKQISKGSIDHLSYSEIVSIINFYRQRLRNYAHIESLSQAKINEARIIPSGLPRAVICEFYEGKIISVKDAYEKVQWLKTLSQEEYYKKISTKNFEIPPLYKNCRCSLEGIVTGVDNSYERFIKPKEKNVWDFLNEFHSKISNIKTEDFYEIYDLGIKVSLMLEDYPLPQAKLERKLGEILLEIGDKQKALFHLKRAFEINNKVGVKKLIEKLSN